MTPVLFRKSHGEVIAVFPTIAASPSDHGTCYAHVGQHSGFCWEWYRETAPAKPSEYQDLLAELRGIGYDDLKIYRRWAGKWGE